MATTTTSPAQTRALKRPRTQAELAAQAVRFGADWQPGDKVMTWIRRHEAIGGELTRLVRDGWSWADVGRAMALAGIKYETGGALSSATLQCKAAKARAEERRRRTASVTLLPAPATEQTTASPALPFPTLKAIPPVPRPEPQPDAEEEFEFRPAALAGWSGTRITRDRSEPRPAPEPAVKVDAADVVARLLGRK